MRRLYSRGKGGEVKAINNEYRRSQIRTFRKDVDESAALTAEPPINTSNKLLTLRPSKTGGLSFMPPPPALTPSVPKSRLPTPSQPRVLYFFKQFH